MFTDTRKISEDGAWVHVKDGRKKAYRDNEDGTEDKNRPIRIKVLGPDSKTLQGRIRARMAKITKAHGGMNIDQMSEGELVEFMEENSGRLAENMADATIEWENMPDGNGGNLPCTVENAVWLYDAYPAILRQLRAETSEIDDFLTLAKRS